MSMFNDDVSSDYAWPADDEVRDSRGDAVKDAAEREDALSRRMCWDADDGGPGQDYVSAFQDLLDPW